MAKKQKSPEEKNLHQSKTQPAAGKKTEISIFQVKNNIVQNVNTIVEKLLQGLKSFYQPIKDKIQSIKDDE